MRILRPLALLVMTAALFLASSGTALAQDNQDSEVHWVEDGNGDALDRIVNGHHVIYRCTFGRIDHNLGDFSPGDDTDSDGIADTEDAFQINSAEQFDSDGDCFGDGLDKFPLDPLVWGDQDGDGIADIHDDNDGLVDGPPGAYAHCTLGYTFPITPFFDTTDADGDGVNDIDDAFPWNPDANADADDDCVADEPPEIQAEEPSEIEAAEEQPKTQAAAVADSDLGGLSLDLSHCSEGYVPAFERVDEGDSDDDGTPDLDDGFPYDYGADEDGDCVSWEDEYPDDPTEWSDFDWDEIGDNADPDDDNDGVLDEDDLFPRDSSEWQDSDGDGIGDYQERARVDTDGDGTPDIFDAFPDDPAETTDTDGDGIGDNADLDDDNDDVLDADDLDPLQRLYFDDVDDDGDGIVNDRDEFPTDPTEYIDTDFDGIGDNADPDDDNDGVLDENDLAPTMLGDAYYYADDPDFEIFDMDGDGVEDWFDQFPEDPTAYADWDEDGIPNSVDPDLDNDGYENEIDAFPEDPNEWADTNNGGIGDNRDTDRDGDGIGNDEDPFPTDPDEWADSDGDGIGDNADLDDDNDGVNDDEAAQTSAEEAVFEELKTGDPELDAMLREILEGGDPYSSSSSSNSFSSSPYSNNSTYAFNSGYSSGGSSSSGPSARAIKWMILLPLLFIKMLFRSDDRPANR